MSKGSMIVLSIGVVAVIVIIFIFMGGGWSQAEQDRWTDTCMLLGNTEYCDCTLEYLMDKYPDYSDFEANAIMAGAEAGGHCGHTLFNY